MFFYKTTRLAEKRRVCELLVEQHPFIDKPLFEASIPRFLTHPRCHFFVVNHEIPLSVGQDPYAFGIIREYQEPFNELQLFGLEAVCFADGDVASHIEIIMTIRGVAAQQDVDGLCVSEKSLGHAATFRELMRIAGVKVLPRTLMQGAEPGVYSAFTESPDDRAFFAHCLAFATRVERWDFEGVEATGTAPLYRGEGRLAFDGARARWNCASPGELAQYFIQNGFRGRAEGVFTGTMQAQLLQQGYVDQPTVSLSDSFESCAYYATSKYTRKEGAVVFELDRNVLLERVGVYDTLATLKKCCPWVLGGFYDLIVKVMSVLDAGENDVRRSGEFLQNCHENSRRRVEEFGGGRTLGPPVDWPTFLEPDVFKKLDANQIDTQALGIIKDEFESFWNVALGKTITMDRVFMDGRPPETMKLSQAYFRAFENVRPELEKALGRNQANRYNHPGWDLSPFGYVTKCIRDREFLSKGDIPGHCITNALTVDQQGRKVPS